MPAARRRGCDAEAAFVAYCAEARRLDAIKVGSLLLHQEQLALDLLEQLLD